MSTHAPTPPDTSAAATNVPDFLQDLDGGQFERMLSIAASKCAAASVDWQKPAEVIVKLSFKPIKGTHQVHIHHELKFTSPTEIGKQIEHAVRSTPMHVGRFGKLTLVPESQTQMFTRDGQVNSKD